MNPGMISNGDWKGWTLGIAIAIIGTLSAALAGGTFTLVREMRTEILQRFEKKDIKDAEQDRCIAGLEKIQGILEANQKERLERERMKKIK